VTAITSTIKNCDCSTSRISSILFKILDPPHWLWSPSSDHTIERSLYLAWYRGAAAATDPTWVTVIMNALLMEYTSHHNITTAL